MFKKCKVVMLPTNEKANLCYVTPRNKLYWNKNGHDKTEFTQPHHLYILSDDKIYVDDNIMDLSPENSSPIRKVHANVVRYKNHPNFYKIIASTNPKLNLPKPSKAFIQKYCDKGGIDEIKVRYKVEPISDYAKKTLGILPDNRYWVLGDRGLIPNSYWLKCNFGTIENISGSGFLLDEDIKCVPITKNNIISIKPISKKTFNRLEVISLLDKFQSSNMDLESFIENNL